MFGFIIVVIRGNIEELINTAIKQRWSEEWYAYFEIIYGKSLLCWVDVAEKYKASNYTMRRVFDVKLDLVLASRNDWPWYTTYNEDKTY